MDDIKTLNEYNKKLDEKYKSLKTSKEREDFIKETVERQAKLVKEFKKKKDLG